MAIAFNNAVDGGDNGGTGSLTFSFTRASSPTGLLIVPIVGDIQGGVDDISSVTFDGVSLSLLAKLVASMGPDNRFLYFYYGLFSAHSGAHNVVITSSSNHHLLGGAADYTGVKQTSQPDASNTHIGSGSINSLTSSITTINDNSWVIVAECGGGSGFPPTVGIGATTRRTFDGASGTWGLFDSGGAVTPAGSYSFLTARPSGDSNTIAHVIGSFQPDTGGGGGISLSRIIPQSSGLIIGGFVG